VSSRPAVELRDGRWLLADAIEPVDGGWELERLGTRRLVAPADLAEARSGDPVRTLFFPLGTDKLGRDLWSRIVFGARISLAIGLLATAISLLVGVLVGTAAALGGRWLDAILMRLVDALLMFPRLFLVLALTALTGAHFWIVVLVLGLTGWMSVSRLVRAELRQLREAEYVLAARAIGQHPLRILTRHMLPAALSPVLVEISLRVGTVILVEAALSFLGLGVQPPTPSWGNIIADGVDALGSAWWVTTFPGLAISAVVIAFNMLGDGLRDRLDPRRLQRR
jgi:peptide/nickel transport system permease protein